MLLIPPLAHGYIGPGAGFGILTSFVVFLNAIAVSLLSFLFWPVMEIIRAIKKSKRPLKTKCKKIIIIGLDGLSPFLVEKYWENGDLPNLKKLSERGKYKRLTTTTPGISPVAWSSFQTGVNPGKHGIFDFLAPDRERYLAVLSSVKTKTYSKKNFLGIKKEEVTSTLMRMSKPFWGLLGKYGIRSTVLRVPITYPPEPLDGRLLSGMCVPDLRGSQGSYTVMATESNKESFIGGIGCILSPAENNRWVGQIPGPDGCKAVEVSIQSKKDKWLITCLDEKVLVSEDELSEWLTITYKAGRTKVKGIARFKISNGPLVYCTALHVDPSSPVVPLSHPVHYSRYLAGSIGQFATLGLAEDTWALSNGHIDEKVFLKMAYDYFEERKNMINDAMINGKDGLMVCVVDTSDRIQHMFWGNGTELGSEIHKMYIKMDELVGEVLSKIGKNEELIVMSDHGFLPFHTCIDFNKWLVEEGYMVLEDGVTSVQTSYHGVNWQKTKAYALGLSGININLKNREGQGIVSLEEKQQLMIEIREKLLQLQDKDKKIIRTVKFAKDIYTGAYIDRSPDIIPGTESGYRADWGCVTGCVGKDVIYPNNRHWNGDHSHSSDLVNGVLFTSWKHNTENPAIIDIAPTVLKKLGVKPPRYMDGKEL